MVWYMHVRGLMQNTCLYCLCIANWVSFFDPCTIAINDHSQSAKDIDPYLKSQLYVEDPGHRKPTLILPNRLSKPGERVHGRN